MFLYAWPHARVLMNSFIRGEKVERGMRVKKKEFEGKGYRTSGSMGKLFGDASLRPPGNEQKSSLTAVMCFSGVALLMSVSSSGRGSRT